MEVLVETFSIEEVHNGVAQSRLSDLYTLGWRTVAVSSEQSGVSLFILERPLP